MKRVSGLRALLWYGARQNLHRSWKLEARNQKEFATEARRTRRLAKAVGAIAKEFEEAEVAEDLELLADFVIDVSIFGMEFG